MERWTRREDERLLTGKGRYVADIHVPGCLDAAFVRSKRTYEADASRTYDAGADRSHDAGVPSESRAPRVLFEVWAPPPRLLVFGANAHAAAVSRIDAHLGYHVTVCDARATFTTPERFPDADEVVVDWPHRYLAATETDHRTVVCVMTHDAKFDVPVLA
ncbi:hypothetical protein SY2F82_57450 [Streptomyces sp. Y2F8-2]|nr:hypothetical protein SY2F82_57450 [Streptomyces sp. Y2F8-2]